MKTEFNTDKAANRKLSDLQPGESGVIRHVNTTGPVAQRLLELGLLPRTPVHALRRAPLGDPTVFEFRGYRLCLRQDEAEQIEIDDPRPSASV